jgi:hypothetical protein
MLPNLHELIRSVKLKTQLLLPVLACLGAFYATSS